jgi:hypothetical protein
MAGKRKPMVAGVSVMATLAAMPKRASAAPRWAGGARSAMRAVAAVVTAT